MVATPWEDAHPPAPDVGPCYVCGVKRVLRGLVVGRGVKSMIVAIQLCPLCTALIAALRKQVETVRK